MSPLIFQWREEAESPHRPDVLSRGRASPQQGMMYFWCLLALGTFSKVLKIIKSSRKNSFVSVDEVCCAKKPCDCIESRWGVCILIPSYQAVASINVIWSEFLNKKITTDGRLHFLVLVIMAISVECKCCCCKNPGASLPCIQLQKPVADHYSWLGPASQDRLP